MSYWNSGIPATRKLCSFLGCSAEYGCSKCWKRFPCAHFEQKVDYAGFDRDEWTPREHTLHLKHAMEVKFAKTASRQHELQKQYGLRYSELLRIPYLDIVQHHVVDPMHNMLLGTSKHMMKGMEGTRYSEGARISKSSAYCE